MGAITLTEKARLLSFYGIVFGLCRHYHIIQHHILNSVGGTFVRPAAKDNSVIQTNLSADLCVVLSSSVAVTAVANSNTFITTVKRGIFVLIIVSQPSPPPTQKCTVASGTVEVFRILQIYKCAANTHNDNISVSRGH